MTAYNYITVKHPNAYILAYFAIKINI